MTLGNGSTITIGDAEGHTFTLSGDGVDFVWVDVEGRPAGRRGTPQQRRLTKLHRLQAARRAAKAKK